MRLIGLRCVASNGEPRFNRYDAGDEWGGPYLVVPHVWAPSVWAVVDEFASLIDGGFGPNIARRNAMAARAESVVALKKKQRQLNCPISSANFIEAVDAERL